MKMRNKILFTIFGLVLLINYSCLQEKPTVVPDVFKPTIETTPVVNPTVITPDVKTSTGNVNLVCSQQNQVLNTKDSICFNTQVLPFMVTNCAKSGCHDSKTKADGYDLSTYSSIIKKGIDLKNPQNSKLYREMLSSMPPAPAPKLLKKETDLILKWITEGAKNVKCNSTIDTTTITFSKTIQPLLETNCVGCHKTGSSSGGVLLDNYSNVKIYVTNNKIWNVMNYVKGYSPMPPSEKLNDCQLLVMKKWIDNGALNN
jgi:hypothetical protein